MGFIAPVADAISPDAPLPSRALQFAMTHIPGTTLVARGLDFFLADPLHHYMDSGMLKGIKERAEGQLAAA